MLYGGRFSDLCYGYTAFWTRVLPQLDLDADGFEIETLMNIRVAKVGLPVTEVPSFEADRIAGHSKLNARRDGMRVLRTIVAEWVDAGAGQTVTRRLPGSRTRQLPVVADREDRFSRSGEPVTMTREETG